ncbi:MAG TPA: 50S ribosomal protein L6 [Candidatus Magasanikbacteria bacterium]|nr:50S ribosomal protein L6 [Candidatus Magasanikbacteria bacterium]
MSRIGKQQLSIPQGVDVTVQDGAILVKGPKGTLKRTLHTAVAVTVENGIVSVSVKHPEEKYERSLWGTFAAHIKNMIDGVTKGFEKKLEVNGVGFRVAMQGKDIKLEIGFSHSVVYKVPAEVTATVEKNIITLVSADVEMLGKTASEIRALKKPEPYKGKGIKYLDEVVRRKAGKTASAGKE